MTRAGVGLGGGGREEGEVKRGGLTQRLASAVRSMRGGVGGRMRATQAYLGVENKFRYDAERRMWVMEGEEGEGAASLGEDGGGFGGGGQSGRLETVDQVKEVGPRMKVDG